MADHEVENLKITLSVDDAGVAEKIDAIKQSFVQLGSAIRGEGAASAIRNLAEGFKIFAETLPKVTSASEAIRKFTDGLATTDFKAFEQGLLNIGNAFSTVKFNEQAAQGITLFSSALTRLSDSAKKFKPTGLERVIAAGEQLDGVAAAVKKAASVGSGFSNLASGIARMPEAIKNMSEVDLHTWTINIGKATYRLEALNQVAKALSGKGVRNFSSLASSLKTFSEFGKVDSNLADNLSRAGDMVVTFAQNISNAIDDNTLKRFKELANAVSRLAASMKQIGKVNFEKVLSGRARAFGQDKGSPRLSERTGFVKVPKKSEYSQGWKGTFTAIKKYVSDVKNARNAVGKAFKSIINGYKLLGTVLATPIVSPLKKLADSIQRTGSKIKASVKKLMADIAKAITRPIVAPFTGLGKAVTSLHSKFTGFLKSVGRIALYRAIRSGIKMVTSAVKEGIDNLYNWAAIVGNSFKPTMDSMASSALYVKNSIAAMVSPLLDALAPALEAITNKAVEFMNTLNQLFATLTGASTWRKAIRTQAEYSAEIDNTSGSLKELKATILGIDEINPLNGDSGRGRGASDIIPDYKGMFEELPISETFDSIKLNFGNLGKKFSDALADALDKINWSSIKSKVNGIVSKFAGFFSEFFGNANLWTSTGRAAGEGLNTVTGAMLTFTDTVEWEKIGDNISTGVTEAIKTINWTNVGKTLVSGIKILQDTFHGFVEGMSDEDWASLGTAVGDTMVASIDAIKWDQILPDLSKFASGLKTAIMTATSKIDIDWSSVVKKLVDGLARKLGSINWTTIRSKARRFATNFADILNTALSNRTLYSTLGTTVSNGINTITGVVNAFQFRFDGNKVGANLGSALKTAISKTNWSNVGKAITAGFKIAADVFHGFISSMTANDWKDLGDKLSETVSAALLNIPWATVIPDLVNFTSGLLSALIAGVKGIKWKKVLNEIWTGVKNADWKSLFDNIGQFLEETWPVFVIPLVFNAASLLTNIGLVGGKWQLMIATIVGSVGLAVGAFQTLKTWVRSLLGDEEDKLANQTLYDLQKQVEEGTMSAEEASRMYELATGKVAEFGEKFTGASRNVREGKKGVDEGTESMRRFGEKAHSSTTHLKELGVEGNKLPGTLNASMSKLDTKGATSAAKSWVQGFADGLSDKAKLKSVKEAADAIVGKILPLNPNRDDSPFYPYTWGTHLTKNFADGMSSASSLDKITTASKKVAATAQTYLAFSKPDKGPLSDADTYGPDFVALFAEGMAKKAYLVTNAAKAIASQAEAVMPVNANVSSQVTTSLGADSTALIRSVAQGAEDANAAQNELLREQNALLRQILNKTGEGVSAGAIVSSMERASRRAGVAVAVS